MQVRLPLNLLTVAKGVKVGNGEVALLVPRRSQFRKRVARIDRVNLRSTEQP
jgi:hypothetical protein